MFTGTGRGDCHIFITSGFTVGQHLGGETSQVALVVKNPPANAGDVRDTGLIRGGGHGNPLQYSCLENSMDREAWQAIAHEVTKISFCHKGGVICISAVIDISLGNLDSSLCFFQPSISHGVFCIYVK